MKISTKNNRKINNHCQLVKQDKKNEDELYYLNLENRREILEIHISWQNTEL